METLPNDIIRLILVEYLASDDAINCFLHLKIFHYACNETTLHKLKRKYFNFFGAYANKYENAIYVEQGNKVCSCSAIVQEKNAGKHQRKCLFQFPLPQNCPDCNKKLYIYPYELFSSSPAHYYHVYLHHFRKHCPAKSSRIRSDIRKQIDKETRTKKLAELEELKRLTAMRTKWFGDSLAYAFVILVTFASVAIIKGAFSSAQQ